MMLLDALEHEQAEAEAVTASSATPGFFPEDNTKTDKRCMTNDGHAKDTLSHQTESHALISRDFIAHLVDFVESITGQEGSNSLASLFFPSLVLPPQGHTQQAMHVPTISTSLHPLLLPLVPILTASFQAAIQASSSMSCPSSAASSVHRTSTRKSTPNCRASTNMSNGSLNSLTTRGGNSGVESDVDAMEEAKARIGTVPFVAPVTDAPPLERKRKTYYQPPSGIAALLSRTEIPTACPIQPFLSLPCRKEDGLGWEAETAAVRQVRQVLEFLVERGLTGTDSAVEVAHAILHTERYFEKYHRVRRGWRRGEKVEHWGRDLHDSHLYLTFSSSRLSMRRPGKKEDAFWKRRRYEKA